MVFSSLGRFFGVPKEEPLRDSPVVTASTSQFTVQRRLGNFHAPSQPSKDAKITPFFPVSKAQTLGILAHLLRMVVEPKYYAFPRWLDTRPKHPLTRWARIPKERYLRVFFSPRKKMDLNLYARPFLNGSPSFMVEATFQKKLVGLWHKWTTWNPELVYIVRDFLVSWLKN